MIEMNCENSKKIANLLVNPLSVSRFLMAFITGFIFNSNDIERLSRE